MKTRLRLLVFITGVALFLTSCEKDEATVNSPAISATVNGYTEKGPFITGTRVTIYEVDRTLKQTGKSYEAAIENDYGRFEIEGQFQTPFAQIIANGYYFNEVTGRLSSSQLTLKSIVSLDSSGRANVNVLTSLAFDRTRHLLNSTKLSYPDAKTQAEKEVLAIFNIEPASKPFERLDIHDSNDDNAKLLAVSSVLQADNSEAQLSELIAKISMDIKEDGVLDDQQILTHLKINSMGLDMLKIRENLTTRYRSIGMAHSIPPFEKYAKALLFIPQDQIIRDANTNLIWLRSSPTERLKLQDAIKFCEALEVGEYKNWRLASIDELKQIYPYKDALIANCTAEVYWSSTFSHQGAWEGVIYDNYKTIDFRDGFVSSYYGWEKRFLPVHD